MKILQKLNNMNTIWFLFAWYAHQWLSLFFHSFFLHRYGAHKQFTMSKTTEKVFFVLTWLFMGSSFLNPRAYAYMHRLHHRHSDKPGDPHSPTPFYWPWAMGYDYFPKVFPFMWHTGKEYGKIIKGKNNLVDDEIRRIPPPHWRSFERIASSGWSAIVFVSLYAWFYIEFAPALWLGVILFPFTVLSGPFLGSVVNWFGHTRSTGYVNYRDTDDQSANAFVLGHLLHSESNQNNHHKFPNSANFAKKWYEIDTTWWIIKLLAWFKIITLSDECKKELQMA